MIHKYSIQNLKKGGLMVYKVYTYFKCLLIPIMIQELDISKHNKSVTFEFFEKEKLLHY